MLQLTTHNPDATSDDGLVLMMFICMDSFACNFNLQGNMADGSCEYAQGFDCEGNILSSQYQVGDCVKVESYFM